MYGDDGVVSGGAWRDGGIGEGGWEPRDEGVRDWGLLGGYAVVPRFVLVYFYSGCYCGRWGGIYKQQLLREVVMLLVCM